MRCEFSKAVGHIVRLSTNPTKTTRIKKRSIIRDISYIGLDCPRDLIRRPQDSIYAHFGITFHNNVREMFLNSNFPSPCECSSFGNTWIHQRYSFGPTFEDVSSESLATTAIEAAKSLIAASTLSFTVLGGGGLHKKHDFDLLYSPDCRILQCSKILESSYLTKDIMFPFVELWTTWLRKFQMHSRIKAIWIDV